MEERFVGRGRELSSLRVSIREGRSVALIGGRRAGKTSLLQRIGDVGRPVFHTSGDKLAFAGEELALRKLAKTIGATWTKDWDAFDGREAIEERLRAVGSCALVIDELDRILALSWAGGFLAWLRSLVDTSGLGRGFAVVVAGGPVLDHYRNPNDHGSPVLNLAERLYLDPLDHGAIEDLVSNHVGAPTAEQLREVAGGQPALAQLYLRACTGTPGRDVDATFLDASRSHVLVWREQLGAEGQRFLRELHGGGTLRSGVASDEGYLRARYLCLIRFDGERVIPGPARIIGQLVGAERPSFDVAISYAGEDSRLAGAIHQSLVKRGVVAFFAEDATDWLAGCDLYRVLPNLYGQQAATVLVLCTSHYLTKHWTRIEYDAVRAAHGERIVLLSLDGHLPADWPEGHLYIDGKPENLVRVVDQLVDRVAHSR